MSNIFFDNDCLFIRKGIKFHRINLKSKEIYSKDFFKKDGQARSFKIYDNLIFCKDFCDFYILTKNFELIHHIRLGSDLTTDICGFDIDEKNIYVGIRDGNLAIINRLTFEVIYFKISDYSSWDMIASDKLYVGLVSGELMIINKDNLEDNLTINLHKNNLRSLYKFNEKLYTASQDLSIKCLDLKSFKVEKTKRSAHKKMFKLIGVYKDALISVSHPCYETVLWNLNDFEIIETINLGRWDMELFEDNIYFIDRFNNLGYINLNTKEKIVIEEYQDL